MLIAAEQGDRTILPAHRKRFDERPDLWNLLPPNGSINIIDIGAAIIQFGHTCA